MTEIKQILRNVPLGWAITFFVCFGVDIALLIVSFFIPPQGIIDPSVLTGAALLFAFPTLYTAYACIQNGIAARYKVNIGGVEVGLETESNSNNMD